ncbi:MAG: hypothetical protein Q4B86_07970 [Eubacteriales bacterium]|nr:hypothetical protein [Eubacteriales bacterium]
MYFKSKCCDRCLLLLFGLILSSFFATAGITAYAATGKLNIEESAGKKSISISRQGIFEEVSLIPGDTVQGELEVSNKTGNIIYYRLKGIYGHPEGQKLMDSLKLIISDKSGKTLYDGSFSKAYTPELIIDKGKVEKYKYSLHIPISCGNEIQGETRNLRFVYLVSDRENGTIDGSDGSGDSDGNTDNDEDGNDDNQGGSSGGSSSGGGSSGGNSSGGGSHGPSSQGGGHAAGSGFNGGKFNNTLDTSSMETAAAKVYAVPDLKLKNSSYEGSWEQRDNKWSFKLKDGTYIKDGWALLFNPYGQPKATSSWYYFDKDGYMQTGWIRCENESWYYANEVSNGNRGNLVTGWLNSTEDGHWYYLSELNGRMLSGWNKIKDKNGLEKEYYFAKLEDTYRQNWFFNTAFGRWIYKNLGGRTYGSLFMNEKTPDGYTVDENGAKLV